MDRSLAVPLVAVSLGVVAHHGYFIHGDHLTNIPPLLLGAGAFYISAIVLQVTLLSSPVIQSWLLVTTIYAAFATGLYSSIFIYRVWFHRLNEYPGPWGAKVSKLYHMYHIRRLDQWKWYQSLIEQYGTIVRIGPNHLLVSEPDAVVPIHGTRTKCFKGANYDAALPMTTLHQMRDRATHDRRRRSGWDQAFTTHALRSYDNRLLKYASQLETLIRKSLGKPIDIAARIEWYSFDVMGDLGFGKSFGGLTSEQEHWAIQCLKDSNKVVGLLAHNPWLFHLATKLPASWSPLERLIQYSEQAVEERRQKPPAENDVMSHLLEGHPFFTDPKEDRLLLAGDSRLLIIAGSDTTATTLTFLTYHMAIDPSLGKKLCKELADHDIHDSDSISVNNVRDLPYLNGLIRETLRLHPPVPSVLVRDTPPEGLHFGDTSLPGDIQVSTPNYSIHRDPRAFVQPDDFVPERWSTRPELILNRNAFFPFSIGAFACVGKQLAYNEMRTVAASLALSFEVRLADGEDGTDLLENTVDVFVTNTGKLNVVFEERAREKRAA